MRRSSALLEKNWSMLNAIMKISPRLWAILLCLPILNLTPSGPAHTQIFNPPNLDPRKNTDALVAITVKRKMADVNGNFNWEEISSGTGFIVSSLGYVITARHNFPNCPKPRDCEVPNPPLLPSKEIMNADQVAIYGHVGDRNRREEPMVPINIPEGSDFVLLQFQPRYKYSFFPVGDPWTISTNDNLVALGFSKDEPTSSVSAGRYTGEIGAKGSWKVTMDMGRGMSGGPVVDPKTGGVVAIIYGGVEKSSPPLGYVHPINHGFALLRIAGTKTPKELIEQRKNASSNGSSPAEIDVKRSTQHVFKVFSSPINRIKNDHPNPSSSHSELFKHTFKADKGYVFSDPKIRILNGRNFSNVKYKINEDETTLFVEYVLESGPSGKPWNGWISADIIATQSYNFSVDKFYRLASDGGVNTYIATGKLHPKCGAVATLTPGGSRFVKRGQGINTDENPDNSDNWKMEFQITDKEIKELGGPMVRFSPVCDTGVDYRNQTPFSQKSSKNHPVNPVRLRSLPTRSN